MNILIIGNGFDLAHELPTKYTDFLEFIKVIKQILNTGKLSGIDWGNTHQEVKNLLITNKAKVQDNVLSKIQMWKDLIDNNIWIEYFLQNNMHGKENWIDFESEISGLIQSLDYDMHGGNNDFGLYDELIILSNDFLDCHDEISALITFKGIENKLNMDLNKLIRALEIYLSEYVNRIECKSISPDINRIMVEIAEHENNIKGAIMSKILCFNYTNTIERIYDISHYSDIDYIHGKAEIMHTMETNNMVLGIDEFLPEKKRDKNIEFIAFKKFYQRIYKQTGCKYKEWVNKIQEDYVEYIQNQMDATNKSRVYMSNSINEMVNRYALRAIADQKCRKHYLYIFGHSLDITDRDVLRDLILNDNVYTTIFYVNKNVMGQQIANLVKVIGQDELIKRTGGSTKTIEFKLQQDMIPIENINPL